MGAAASKSARWAIGGYHNYTVYQVNFAQEILQPHSEVV